MRKPTEKQKKLAQNIADAVVVKRNITIRELLLNSGYAEGSFTSGFDLIARQGVQKELLKLGFTEQAAKAVVAEILLVGNAEDARLKAADMIFKVHGTYAPEKHVSLVGVVLKEVQESEQSLVQKE